jgi:hypothetical protein
MLKLIHNFSLFGPALMLRYGQAETVSTLKKEQFISRDIAKHNFRFSLTATL